VEAVIDKDYTASLLASSLSADVFIILTGVECVARDFGKPGQTPIRELDVAAARALLAEGQFPPGSMGPKIDAAARFVEAGAAGPDHARVPRRSLEGARARSWESGTFPAVILSAAKDRPRAHDAIARRTGVLRSHPSRAPLNPSSLRSSG
jgi:hypothetical protein